MKTIFYIYGWIFVRPRRWFFWKMIARGSFGLRLLPHKGEYCGWEFTNLHWWLLYKTIFKFFKWLYWEGWRPFCDWTGGWRRTFPWYARAIHRIGQTTAGVAIMHQECWHCGSLSGNPVDLSEDETGTTFILKDSGTCSTPDGTDHWFSGTTICPRCGFKSEYSDGSL
jgi:hypothetical protein